MVNPELAVAPMHRIRKKDGAERMSEAAANGLAKVLEDAGFKVAKEAIDYPCMQEERPLKKRTSR